MFRGCYFEYAGQYSGDYNLMLYYIDDSMDKFDSGGKYDLIADTLPSTAESLLYGLKYSENPLEFSIEIINPDGAISMEQMRKIKTWLFGQDCWKKLILKDEDYSKYYLLCLLVPDSDITDVTGYRGIRCQVKNISPFWYGETKTKTITYDEMKGHLTSGLNYEFDINIDTDTPLSVPAVIKFTDPGAYTPQVAPNDDREFWVKNQTNNSLLHRFMNEKSFWHLGETWSFDTRLLQFESLNSGVITNYIPLSTTNEIFYLQRGLNHISVACHDIYDEELYFKDFSISYTPCYRIGGF